MPEVPRYDDILKQGAPWELNLTFKDDNDQPINLTGYKGKMVAREEPNGDLVFEASTTSQPSGYPAGNGYMTLGGAAGTVAVALPKSVTLALAFERAVYDLWLFDGADLPIPVIEGRLTFDPMVTSIL